MADYGHSLLLDLEDWDITLDQGGNISQASGDYALAQDVSNRIRLFTNDAYYNPEQGIPHFVLDLGVKPSEALVRSRYTEQALAVNGVSDAKVENIEVNFQQRELHGSINISTLNGGRADVNI